MFSLIQIVLVLICIVFSSCGEDFLTKEPPGVLADPQMRTQRGVEALLTGAYHQLRANSSYNNAMGTDWTFASACSDDAYKGSDASDQAPFNLLERYEALPTNSYMNDRWTACYEGVARSNRVLFFLKAVQEGDEPFNAARATVIEAEAKYLRAYYHFSANRIFKTIPYIRTPDEQDRKTPSEIPNTDAGWSGIEEDLAFAIANLPPSWTGQPGRVTSWAAKTMLAQAYMYQNRLSDAKPILDDIIDNGGFALVNRYFDNYDERTENNSESIFEIQCAVEGSINTSLGLVGPVAPQYGPANFGWGFFQPSHNLFEAHQVDNDGLPVIDPSQRTPLASDMGIEGAASPFTPTDHLLDPRVDWSIGRRGIPFLDWGIFAGSSWIRLQSNGGPYMTKKYIHFNATRAQQAANQRSNNRNFRYHRLAHVILWRAEVAVEDGDLELARQLVNQIRRRAGNQLVMGYVASTTIALNGRDDHTGAELVIDNSRPAANYLVSEWPQNHPVFSSKETAREAVRLEIRLEFATEGQRFFDLRRWGQSSVTPDYDIKVLNDYIAHDIQVRSFMTGAVYTTKFRYWPIPQSQLDIQPGVLTQDPDYL